ncbi:zinc finger BED domain-containing 4-like [Brachionus plicatilis]|uniref:Zinc finger BED domain-containing 4-like n=1 Tax=Brachionus plicatilis TaxID=10195 RepID=A0A3M7Q2Y1_BRAPC|nr:zinc finger BED domain-containing 4-like [Brachionus plicatilis]
MKYKLKKRLIKKLSKLESINIITDIWSDATMCSFIWFKACGIKREEMNELIFILKELEICTDILQGDGITISRILPIFTVNMIIDLKSNHEAIMAKDKTIKNKIFYFENVSKKLIVSIKKRFEDIFDETIYNIAAMLDPNYGTIWIKHENKQSWILKLKSIVEEIDTSESWKDASKSIKKNRSPTSNWTITYEEESFTEHFEVDIIKKIKAMITSIPLTGGKERASFPSLAKIAKKIVGIPATTESVERFFSKTGYILRQHRLKMADTLAENLFHLKENRVILNEKI